MPRPTSTVLALALAAACSAPVLAAEPAQPPVAAPAPTTGVAPAPVPAPLSLKDAIALSVSVIDVQLAELDRDAAAAQIGIARADLLPTIDATGTFNRSKTVVSAGTREAPPVLFGPDNVWDGRLRLGQQLIDTAAWLRRSAAVAGAEVAGEDKLVALERAASNAALAYVNLSTATALVEVRRQDLAIAEDLKRLADAQVQAGVAESISGTRAATQVTVVRGALLNAQQYADQAALTLDRAIGQPAGTPYRLSGGLDEALAASDAPRPTAAALEALRRWRPELRSSAARVAAARLDRRAVSAERLPTADLFADIGRTGAYLDHTATTWEAGVQVTVPILDGFRREARIDAADVAIRRAAAQQRDLDDQLASEVRDALIGLDAQDEQLTVARERLRLAELELNQARERFKSGIGTNLDVITAQQGLSDARSGELNVRSTAANARVRLARAVGVATTLR
jgi:outer membrane protein TolC